MSKKQLDLSLYLVTDRTLTHGRDICNIAEQAAQGGVTCVQLREKDCDTGEFVLIAQQLKLILDTYNIPLIINDRIDVALAVDAAGVHIGQNDMPYQLARKLMGDDKIIGLSIETIEEAQAANLLDVDYIGISPIFSTTTKNDIKTPFGIEGAKKVVELSRHPSVAIGGINLANTTDVMSTGIDGIAVVSAIVSAANPQESTQELLNKISQSKINR